MGFALRCAASCSVVIGPHDVEVKVRMSGACTKGLVQTHPLSVVSAAGGRFGSKGAVVAFGGICGRHEAVDERAIGLSVLGGIA